MKMRWPIIILTLLVAVRVAIAIGHDDPLSHDELAHFSYVSYVNQFKDLPDFASAKGFQDKAGDEYQGFYWYETFQQPGFYVAASPFIAFGSKGVRLFSLSLWLGGVFLIWSICRKWWMLLFLCLPGSILVSSMVTNQSLEFFGAAMLAYGICEESDMTVMTAAIVMCLARVTGIAVCVGLAGWYMYRQHGRAFFFLPGIIAGLWAFMDRLPLFAVNSTEWQTVRQMVENIGHAIVTGVYDPMQGTASWMGAVGYVAIIFGGALLAKHWRWFIQSERGVVTATCAAILAWFGLTHGFSEGRLLYAAVPFVVIDRG